jgi:hypothetical protein
MPQGANHQRKAVPAARAALIAGVAGPSAPAGCGSPVAELERLGMLASGAGQVKWMTGTLFCCCCLRLCRPFAATQML